MIIPVFEIGTVKLLLRLHIYFIIEWKNVKISGWEFREMKMLFCSSKPSKQMPKPWVRQ